jgi:mono/diheme cytochrome c family protein
VTPRRAAYLVAVPGGLLLAATLALAAAPPPPQPQPRSGPPGGPPPAAPAPDPASGAGLFASHCGICHFQMGPGTIMLGRRLGPEHALLAERTDLDPDYVKHVVREGIGGMPPQTRVDLTNVQLDAVAAWLTRPASERTPPHGPPQGPPQAPPQTSGPRNGP